MLFPFANLSRLVLFLAIVLFAFLPEGALAADKKTLDSPESKRQQADVEKIEKEYWARQEEELSVVQQRLYTNRRKIELNILLGSVSSDPFLVNRSLTVTAGYHFSELFSVHLGLSKNFVSGSSAKEYLEQDAKSVALTNMQRYWLTVDSRWNLAYGKMNFFEKSILQFDWFLSGGFGMVSTESGNYFAIMPGIGQTCHLTEKLAISIHYKLFWYKERILSKAAATAGQLLGTNENLGSTLMVGIKIALDPFSPSKAAAAN